MLLAPLTLEIVFKVLFWWFLLKKFWSSSLTQKLGLMSFDGPNQFCSFFTTSCSLMDPKKLMSFDGPKSKFSPFKMSSGPSKHMSAQKGNTWSKVHSLTLLCYHYFLLSHNTSALPNSWNSNWHFITNIVGHFCWHFIAFQIVYVLFMLVLNQDSSLLLSLKG